MTHTPPIRLPLKLRALNALGPLMRRIGAQQVRTDPAWYIDWARKKRGLSDFGPYDVRSSLGAVLKIFGGDADLNLFGRLTTNSFIKRNLINLLNTQEAFRTQPGLVDVDVSRPLIVVASPRTGTTLLQRLLGLHPDARTLKLWELHRPSPPPSPETEATDPRVRASEREFGMFYRLVPGMRRIHAMAPRDPEECIHLFVNIFTCRTSFAVIYNVSRYTEWVQALDMVPAYRQFERELKVLNLNYPGKILVLKSPAHLQCLEALATVFPGARVVHLHRDPVAAAGSYCSLSEAVQITLRERVDCAAIGDTWNRVWTPAILNSMRIRGGLWEDVLDVRYPDLVSRPYQTTRGIFEHFGLAVPDDLEDRVAQYLREHPKGKHGKHVYDITRYGLDRTTLEDTFAGYLAEVGLDVGPSP